ncbi:hypothetical protein OA93_20955 [Flavobacterium sp. KMS]|uniref:hypothetical protein n=1 Tax=Flavobacterium sp. KMS TaxID=1566023 RepID=UPI00057E8731|nr:hypothetical protein [Flavobacterium sp. KMS]KIA93930.1 hypothetical protein OA93_20955 [Flavobacterium sp. KMS]
MLKKGLLIFIISIAIISCSKKIENNTSIGIVANLKGIDLFSNEDLSSKKLHHLDYASKIKIISLDTIKNISKILYKNQELYAPLHDVELLSQLENEKSYFSIDCYCLLGLKEIKTINYPTKYDTIHYFIKDDKVRLIKQVSCFQPSYETYKQHDFDINKDNYEADRPNLYSYLTIDKNDFFIGNSFMDENKSYLECYNKKSTFEISNTTSKLSKYRIPEDFNYAIDLFNIDLLFAKIDNNSFTKPLPNFDYKKETIYLEQSDLYLEKTTNIKLYSLSDFKSITYNENAIQFNYLRDFKIIKKDGKKRYFVKINILESINSNLTGEYYIDLKEVAMFASIPD